MVGTGYQRGEWMRFIGVDQAASSAQFYCTATEAVQLLQGTASARLRVLSALLESV